MMKDWFLYVSEDGAEPRPATDEEAALVHLTSPPLFSASSPLLNELNKPPRPIQTSGWSVDDEETS